jgi:hypothetical protein
VAFGPGELLLLTVLCATAGSTVGTANAGERGDTTTEDKTMDAAATKVNVSFNVLIDSPSVMNEH